MILHIPHSRTGLIDEVEINNLDENINLLTDWYVDSLFNHEAAQKLIFNYSRFVVDVERFRSDPM